MPCRSSWCAPLRGPPTVPLPGADPHHAADLSQGRLGALVLQRFRGSLDLDGNRCNAYVVQTALRDVGAQGPGHPVVSVSRLTPVLFWACKAMKCCITDARSRDWLSKTLHAFVWLSSDYRFVEVMGY